MSSTRIKVPCLIEQGWEFLGSGNRNFAFKSKDGKQVFKVQYDGGMTDSPQRSVRLWNEINYRTGKAEIAQLGDFNGWICPFIEGRMAKDDEVFQTIITIYKETGRIVVDAIMPGNIVISSSGIPTCIDIGLALNLNSTNKRHSKASFHEWKKMQESINELFKLGMMHCPKSTNLIKALLYLSQLNISYIDAEQIGENDKLIAYLAIKYDSHEISESATKKIIKLLSKPHTAVTGYSTMLSSFFSNPGHDEEIKNNDNRCTIS